MGNNSSTGVTKLADPQQAQNQKDRQIVLVLQGGGALGAYQAGVYHALHEQGIEPDWIVGTSIGAINASLIAGNPHGNRLEALKEFWSRMAYRPPFGVRAWTGLPDMISYWKTILRGIPDFLSLTLRRSSGPMSHLGLTQPASIPRLRWKRHCSSWSTSRW